MRLSRRRVGAMWRKELREYRRSGSIVAAMAIIPLVFMVQPLATVLAISSGAAAALRRHHELVYMLGTPALLPAMLASYSVVGERQQGTLEPVLGTPIRREELILAKAFAVLAPTIVLAYVLYGLFLAAIALFAQAGVASALIHPSDVIAQAVFTPLIAGWSIWLAVAISTRASDIRVAQQLSVLAALPTVAVTTLISLDVIHGSPRLTVLFGVALLAANRLGWRLVARLFDRERLIAGTR
jgi:ABC-type Na+ efflux pump permease subunit